MAEIRIINIIRLFSEQNLFVVNIPLSYNK